MTNTGLGLMKKQALDISVEVAIRLTVIAALVIWCFQIFQPFILPIMWGMSWRKARSRSPPRMRASETGP